MKHIARLAMFTLVFFVVPNLAVAHSSGMNEKDMKGMDMKGMDMKGMDMKGMDMKSMDMKSMDMQNKGQDKKTATSSHKASGVVKEVNTGDGAITLAHEPIKSLNWPAMTMAFKVKDKNLLDKLKPGDKVDVTLVQAGKDYVITSVK